MERIIPLFPQQWISHLIFLSGMRAHADREPAWVRPLTSFLRCRPLGTLHADLYPALCDYIFICSSRGMMDRAKEFHLWAIEVIGSLTL